MKNGVSDAEEAVKKCYSTWGKTYFDNWYGNDADIWPGHVKLIRDLLISEAPKNLLDAGCGPASVLRLLTDLKIDLHGFDLTPEMLNEAREIMADHAFPTNNLWQGSVLNAADFVSKNATIAQTGFDSLISIGVMPHIPVGQDRCALENMHNALKNNGLVIIEARNSLFGLFTFNRYTWDFLSEKLLRKDELEKLNAPFNEPLAEGLAIIQNQLRMDLPPVRKGEDGAPGYDEVISRTHVPFELVEIAKSVGFKDIQLKFYHHHALPPMLDDLLPQLSEKASRNMDDPDDWRGYFMASAFLLIARA